MGNGVAAAFVFFIIFCLECVTVILNYLKKRGPRSGKQMQLKQEIKQLLKEASSLSTPSTFAQAAKLRRTAAAKEKELAQYQESTAKDIKWSPDFYLSHMKTVKSVTYLGLTWWFWSTFVAVVPAHLLQPFGRLLFKTDRSSPTGNIVQVGIIPWLVLTNQVSDFAIKKLSPIIIRHLEQLIILASECIHSVVSTE